MSTNIKLSKAQLPKMTQSEGFLWALLDKFLRPLMKVALPLTKIVLTLLATMGSAATKDRLFKKKLCGKDVVRAGKGITLVISNEDVNDLIRIKK